MTEEFAIWAIIGVAVLVVALTFFVEHKLRFSSVRAPDRDALSV